MFQKEVTGKDNVRWTCVQAYAGLEGKEKTEIDDLSGTNDDKVEVVCTPSGGAQTVRVQAPKNWADALSDEELVNTISKSQ